APQVAQKGGEYKVRCVHEADLPAARARLLQSRFQLVWEDRVCDLGVFLRSGLRRYRDRAGLERFQAQTLEEATDLGLPPANTGSLFDDLLSLGDGMGRLPVEVFLQRGLVLVQGADRTLVRTMADAVQPSFQVVR